MKLTRRALANEIRTLAAQLDVARTEIDQLQADVYQRTAERDRALVANVRLARQMEQMEHDGEMAVDRLRGFLAQHPSLFDPEGGTS